MKSHYKKLPGPTAATHNNFDQQHKVMEMFCDNAKTYIQLSGAALGLTLTFAREILRLPTDQAPDIWMILMWASFLIAVLAGAFYQYLATKYLEREVDWEYYPGWKWISAGSVYGIMLAGFYGGAVIFTVYSIVRLAQH